MNIQVKAVSSKKEMKTFVRFANRLYKENRYYVPAMPSDFIITVIKKRYLKQRNSNNPVSNVVKMSSNLGIEEKENLLNH